MKTQIVCSSLFLLGVVTSSSAQTSTLVNGNKGAPGKSAKAVTTQPLNPLPGAPLVGGSDSCTTPDLIVGTGIFPFDDTMAGSGPQAQMEGICFDWGSMSIAYDVWFKWTATFTGNAEVSLCNGTTMDSRLAAYAGTACPTPGSALACNDDYCGYQSKVNFLCVTGNSYVIQLGVYPLAVGSTGTFTINQIIPPPGDDCSGPIALPGPGMYSFDQTMATSSFQGQAETLCLAANTTQVAQDLWYRYTATVNGNATLTTCGLTGGSPSDDTRIAAYPGPNCPTLGTAIACNDDDGACGVPYNSTILFPVVCGQSYLLQVGHYANLPALPVIGQFSLTESGTMCAPPGGTPYCFGDGSGTACPCGNSGTAGNGCASSVNANGANVAATGNASIASDSLVLSGTGMPNSSCLYFQGTTQISATFGDGLRCAGGSVIRLATKNNVGGASQYPGAGNPSISVKGNVTTPGTRTYQTWYRNAAAFCTPSTFNLTNGVLVTWQ